MTAPTATYKERAWQRREQEILDTAGVLMREHGFENFNMDKLAEAVGVSKPTLYQHFDSKDDLVARVLLSSMETLEERFILPSEGTPLQRLEMVVRFLLHKRYDPNGIWANAGNDVMMDAMHTNPQLIHARRRIHERLIALVDEGKANGVIVSHVATDLIITSLFCLLGAPSKAHPPGGVMKTGAELDAAIEQTVYLYLQAVTAPPR